MIRSFQLSELAQATGGQLVGVDQSVCRISTDTRTLQSGDLFLALTGENHDGHDYVSRAIEAGACGIVVSKQQQVSVSQLLVNDTEQAYRDIACLNRQAFAGKVIALTGSAGKTTCKEMLRQVFSLAGETLATEANLNNTIGVPKTLLEIGPEHQFAIVEMGANAPGEIALSMQCARPDISILINASEAHSDGFGGLAGVRKAKAEILVGLSAQGVAVLNKDDAGYDEWAALAHGQGLPVISFGLSPEAQVSALDIRLDENACAGFSLKASDDVNVWIQLQVPGRHQVMNALAVAAVAQVAGLALSQISQGLESFTGVSRRVSPKPGLHGSLILDDTYNASPSSVVAGIDLLAELPGHRRLILGQMAELGSDSIKLHQQVLDHAELLLDEVWLYGKEFGRAEIDRGNARYFEHKADLIDELSRQLTSNDKVLVKGAFSTGMDEVVQAITIQEKQ